MNLNNSITYARRKIPSSCLVFYIATIHRDITRGGLASVIKELATACEFQFSLIEKDIPVESEVRSACEVLGIDPLHVACEGRYLLFVPSNSAETAVGLLNRYHRENHDSKGSSRIEARIIGEVIPGKSGMVTLRTPIGGSRLLEPPSGEILPRICWRNQMIYTTAAFSAMIFTSLKDMVSKRLAGSVDGTVSTLASFAYTLPYYAVSLLVALLLGFPMGGIGVSFWILVGLRSSTDALAEWLKMTALGHADISLVAPFFALSPVILLILGPVFTGDQITFWGGMGVLLSVLGTVGLLLKRGDSKGGQGTSSLKGILMALGASVFFALNSLFDRLAVQQASVLVSAAAMTAAAPCHL